MSYCFFMTSLIRNSSLSYRHCYQGIPQNTQYCSSRETHRRMSWVTPNWSGSLSNTKMLYGLAIWLTVILTKGHHLNHWWFVLYFSRYFHSRICVWNYALRSWSWKRFPHYWPFMREPPAIVVCMNKLLNKQSLLQWFATPLRSYIWHHCHNFPAISCWWYLGPLLQTWVDFNPNMDKYSYAHWSVNEITCLFPNFNGFIVEV